jgi:hypothetical protein
LLQTLLPTFNNIALAQLDQRVSEHTPLADRHLAEASAGRILSARKNEIGRLQDIFLEAPCRSAMSTCSPMTSDADANARAPADERVPTMWPSSPAQR